MSVTEPWNLYHAGDVFDGWEVTAGSVNLVDGRRMAADGVQAVDLSGDDAGAVSQTFPTVPGRAYRVSYQLAGNLEVTGVKTGRVLINGTFMQGFSFDNTGKTSDDMGWAPRALTFVAGTDTTTVTFQSTTAGPFGPAIDNVKVTGCAGSCGT